MTIALSIGCLSACLWGQSVSLPYSEAYELAVSKGRPLIVLVGAAWCPACQILQRDLLPRLSNSNLRSQVALAIIDLDRETRIGQQLVGEGPIPQIFLFRRVGQRWRGVRLIGVQDFSVIERHIAQLTNEENLDEKFEKKLAPLAPPPPPKPATAKIRPVDTDSSTGG